MSEQHILIVDDDEDIRNLFETIFTSSGYKVFTAGNGREALEQLKDNDIRVMFLDLKMPVMNGLELCKEVRKTQPDSQIFAVTGYFSDFAPDEVKIAGFDDYYFKPVTVDILLEAAELAFEKLTVYQT